MQPRYIFLVFLVAFLMPVTLTSNILMQRESTEGNHLLYENLASLIKKLVAERTVGLDIRIAAESQQQRWLFMDLLKAVLNRLQDMAMTISISNVRHAQHTTVILVDTASSFRKELRSPFYDQSAFSGYLIVYIDEKHRWSTLSSNFDIIFEHHIVNVYVVIKGPEHELYMYSYILDLWRIHGCFSKELYHTCVYENHKAWSWHLGRDVECKFYPDLLSNFYSCQFVVDALHIPPYFIVQNDSKDMMSDDGLEGYILHLLAEKLNFQIVLRTPAEEYISDRIESLASKSSDVISVGRLRAGTQNVSSSVSYYKSDIVLVVRSRRSFYSIERLLSPVSTEIWLINVVLLVVAYNIIRLIRRRSLAERNFVFGAGNRNPTYWLWVIVFGGPAEYRARRNFARFILFQWISWNFFFRTAYQSFVYKSIRMEWKRSTVGSLDEILANGYTLITNEHTYDSLCEVSQLAGLVHIHNGSELNMLEYLEENNQQVAGIVPMEIFQYYQRRTSNTNLSMIKEPLIEQVLCMYFQKNSYLKTAFDRILTTLQDSGLLLHWKRTYLHIVDTTESWSNVPRKLTFGDVSGIFQVHGFLILICFLCLGIELLSVKFRFLRRIIAPD